MTNKQITFIGGGNMARSIIGGLIQSGWLPECLHVSDPDVEICNALNNDFGINALPQNEAMFSKSDVVVLAIKPQLMSDIAAQSGHHISQANTLVLSIAAGVRSEDINRWLGGGYSLVRCMPNTPALLSLGMTALHANDAVTSEQKALADTLMKAVGETVWVEDEKQLDVVTAISGSGPAYFFLLIELMENAAIDMGLDDKTAQLLARQTALGAATMSRSKTTAAALLREQVTSPGGTTERALNVMTDGGIRDLIPQALKAARDRAIELGDMLGETK